jgi:hypothetical protein
MDLMLLLSVLVEMAVLLVPIIQVLMEEIALCLFHHLLHLPVAVLELL